MNPQIHEANAPGRSASGRLSVTCEDFRQLSRNTLRGFAVIRIEQMKLTIRDVAIHAKGDKRWAQLPARPQIKDGALVKDATGKVQYVQLFEFTSHAVRTAFSEAVIRAVAESYPNAFDAEAVQ